MMSDGLGAFALARAATVDRARRNAQLRLSVRSYRDAFPGLIGTPPSTTWVSPGGSSPIASATRVPWNSGAVSVLGAELTKVASYDFGENNTNGAWTPGLYSVEFDYYGSDLALRFRNRATNSAQAWVWVDGQPCTTTSDTLTASGSNNAAFYRITFATAAQRRIRVYLRNMDFGGLDINATDSVGPTHEGLTRVAILGDSWFDAATGATSTAEGIGSVIERLLGVEMCHCGQGGTGYIADGSLTGKAVYGDADRVADLVTLNPDVLIVSGTSNDSVLTPGAVGAAAADLYSNLHVALPGVPVIVIGPPMLLSYPPGSLQNAQEIKTAAAAARNVIGFLDQIDPLGLRDDIANWAASTDYAVGDHVYYTGLVREAAYAHTSGGTFTASNWLQTTWISGNGRVGATNGSGNSDIMIANDGTHLSPDGHNFLGVMFAEWITRLWESLT